jgi:5'-nucleotidase
MEAARPLALLSNDDGLASHALGVMRDTLHEHFNVVVVAPETEQSASSHALSLHRPLRLRKVSEQPGVAVFALDGTPADCVYVALHAGTRVLSRRPDVIVSGINRGLNLGQDVFYSGTVAAAREGALRGIPAVAVSAHPHADLHAVAKLGAKIAGYLVTEKKTNVLFNVNVPKKWSGEVRSTRIGSRIYEEMVDFRDDPRGREYLWLGGPGVRHERNAGTDTDAYDDGAASITPLMLDLTKRDDVALTEAIAAHVRGA